VWLFLLLWFAYGAAINSSNLLDFDLQQVGVEAMVERGHFYLDHSLPSHLQSKGDVFTYEGHNYAAKQPGQFMVGALVYFLLHKLGLSYVNNYLLTSALVTFFTSSLVLAASGVALFGIARELTTDSHDILHPRLADRVGTPFLHPTRDARVGTPLLHPTRDARVGTPILHPTRDARVGTPIFWPLAATLSYAFATTAFSYSGIAHHDVLASGYLVIAFYLLMRLSRRSATKRIGYIKAGGAGLLLGLTITTSMLPFFMVVLSVCYFLCLRRWQLLPVFLVGLFVGLLPLFVYDAVSFGNPFLLPNVAGPRIFHDTFFFFDVRNFGDKLAFYATSVVAYAPVFAVGLLGLSHYPRQVKRSPKFLTLIALIIALTAFVLNIQSDGDCQFGPRYLLPAMPFACLGIAGFGYLATASERRLAAAAVVLAGAFSFVVNLVGALGGAMDCPHGQNAFWNNLAAIRQAGGRSYPLALWLLLPLLASTALFLIDVAAWRKTRSSPA
jgi:hypothetical protein